MAQGCSMIISRARRRRVLALLASFVLLTLFSIHVRVGAFCDDEMVGAAISSGESELERTTGRRLLALGSTQSLVEDGEALLRIKEVILDPKDKLYWWKRQGARQALNPCKTRNGTKHYWPGIDCTDKRVTSIDLSNMSLGGTVSPYLATLSLLKHVDLSNNSLSGPIPGELASAIALETLNLGSNRLEGELPSSLGGLGNLTALDVSNNRLRGAIPASIGNLQFLETLNVSRNNLTGPIPQELNSCTRLAVVDLSRNRLQGVVPFQSLKNLTLLHLQENQLQGNFVERLRLDSFPLLRDLDLSNNDLNGSIPGAISLLPLQTQLSLGHNKLNGSIPAALANLSLVQRIDLSSNKLTGNLPDALGGLISLREFVVCSNHLSGALPRTLANLISLVTVNASYNDFSESLPSLAGLESLRVFDASFNNLSGPVPEDFVDFRSLRHLNVSYNALRGEVPFFVEHDDVNSRSFLENAGLCGRNLGNKCGSLKSDSKTKKIVAFSVGGGVAFLVLVVLIYLCCCRCIRSKGSNKSSASVSAELELKFTPEDVSRATQNFTERNYIGVGSMSTVYRGRLPDDTEVAVKRLGVRRGEISEGAEKVLADGFETLGHVRHWTLVKVLGYCCSPDVKALVMEYMPNGTLNSLMYPPLDAEVVREFNWEQRFTAAIGVAQGLKYLHHECPTPTVHGDLKPSNIMFNTFMEVRVSDFGIAKVLGDHGLGAGSSVAALANGYMAPEVATQGSSIKGDVYSFGIIVLEMISGRNPQSLEGGQTLPQWIRATISSSKALHNVLDPILMSELRAQQQRMAMVLGVSLLCTREDPHERPYITEVLKMLDHIKKRPQDGSRRSGRGSRKLRSSASVHQRNREIREEVSEIAIASSPPATPSTSGPPGHLTSLAHNPSLSDWTPNSAHNR